jgi:hypothetical protein
MSHHARKRVNNPGMFFVASFSIPVASFLPVVALLRDKNNPEYELDCPDQNIT